MGNRSTWKGPFINYKFFKEALKVKYRAKTMSRTSTILPFLLGKEVLVYNGKKFVKIKIQSAMLGYKLGSFVPTRVRHIYKKKKIKKKNKK